MPVSFSSMMSGVVGRVLGFAGSGVSFVASEQHGCWPKPQKRWEGKIFSYIFSKDDRAEIQAWFVF